MSQKRYHVQLSARERQQLESSVTHGKPALLRQEVGLTPEAIAARVAETVLEPRGALA